MKNHYFFLVFSVVLLLLSGCSKEFYEGEEAYPRSVALSVSEARRYVESQLSGRTRGAVDSESNPLTLGNYSIDWTRAATSVGDVLYSVDAPVTGAYAYYHVGADSAGNRTLTPMYHKLVVVKEGESEGLSSYLRFYLPDRNHAQTHERSYYDSLFNSNPKTGFTGLSVFTTLDGFPVAAGRYENAKLGKKAFLFDTLRPVDDNWARLTGLLNGIYVGRARTETLLSPTRSLDDTIHIDDPVEIVGQRPPVKWVDHNLEGGVGGGGGLPPIDPYDPFVGGGGGGASGDGDQDDKPSPDSYSKNPKIKTNSGKVTAYLDQIFKDCMGEALIKRVGDVTIEVTDSVSYGVISYYSTGSSFGDFHIQLNPQFNDVMLMEELLHRYQLAGVSPADEHKYKLNREIEAKIGWFMYRQRENRANDVMVKRGLGGDAGIDIFNSLSDYVITGSTHTTEFAFAFMGAESVIRRIPGYSDSAKYPFCEDNIHIDKLLDLMAGCLSTIYNQNK